MNRCIRSYVQMNSDILWYVNDWLDSGGDIDPLSKWRDDAPVFVHSSHFLIVWQNNRWKLLAESDNPEHASQLLKMENEITSKWIIQMLFFRRWPRFPRLLLPDAAFKAPVIEVFRGTATLGWHGGAMRTPQCSITKQKENNINNNGWNVPINVYWNMYYRQLVKDYHIN